MSLHEQFMIVLRSSHHLISLPPKKKENMCTEIVSTCYSRAAIRFCYCIDNNPREFGFFFKERNATPLLMKARMF